MCHYRYTSWTLSSRLKNILPFKKRVLPTHFYVSAIIKWNKNLWHSGFHLSQYESIIQITNNTIRENLLLSFLFKTRLSAKPAARTIFHSQAKQSNFDMKRFCITRWKQFSMVYTYFDHRMTSKCSHLKWNDETQANIWLHSCCR